MSKYIVCLKDLDNVSKNCIYSVIKQCNGKVAIINDMKKEQWIEDDEYEFFKIVY